MSPERVIAYIDGYNLYFGLLDARLQTSRWLDLHGRMHIAPQARPATRTGPLLHYQRSQRPRRSQAPGDVHRRSASHRRHRNRLRRLPLQDHDLPFVQRAVDEERREEDRREHCGGGSSTMPTTTASTWRWWSPATATSCQSSSLSVSASPASASSWPLPRSAGRPTSPSQHTPRSRSRVRRYGRTVSPTQWSPRKVWNSEHRQDGYRPQLLRRFGGTSTDDRNQTATIRCRIRPLASHAGQSALPADLARRGEVIADGAAKRSQIRDIAFLA